MQSEGGPPKPGAPTSGNSIASTPDGCVGTRTMIVLAFSATAGVLVEFYDFFIYG